LESFVKKIKQSIIEKNISLYKLPNLFLPGDIFDINRTSNNITFKDEKYPYFIEVIILINFITDKIIETYKQR